MVSIIIAAHNEEAVLGRTLDALLPESKTAQIIVVANGCTDNTAAVARSRPMIQVVEIDRGSKPLALNEGEAVATSFPRLYLDADIVVPRGAIDAIVDRLQSPGILAAVPARHLNTVGRSWPVRAYSSIHHRLPVFRDGLFGRGLIALSEEGRARFDTFPLMIADDLFIDSLFAPAEKAHVDSVAVTVDTPFTTRDLLSRLVRVRRGSEAMRQAADRGEISVPVRQADHWSWLRDVVARDPRLCFAGVAYATITSIAAIRARRGPIGAMDWGRDESTRS